MNISLVLASAQRTTVHSAFVTRDGLLYGNTGLCGNWRHCPCEITVNVTTVACTSKRVSLTLIIKCKSEHRVRQSFFTKKIQEYRIFTI